MSSEVERKKRRKRKNVRYIPVIGVDMRYLRYLKPFSGLLTVSVILIIGVALLDIIAPWPLKFIIDNVLGGEPFVGPVGDWLTENVGTDQRVLTAVLGLALLLITIFQGLIAFAYEYMNGLIQERATFLLRSEVFSHVQRLPLQFYDQSRLGDVLKRVTDDSGKIMAALVSSMGQFLVDSVKFIGFAIVMLFVNWRFSVIVLAYVPLLLFLYVTFRQNIRETARTARKQEGEMMNLTLETLGAIREVKAFGRESHQLAEFEKHGRDRIRSALRSIRWEASFSPMIDFIQAGSTAAVIWYGVSQVLVGQFSDWRTAHFHVVSKGYLSAAAPLQQAGGQHAKGGGQRRPAGQGAGCRHGHSGCAGCPTAAAGARRSCLARGGFCLSQRARPADFARR